MRDFVRRFLAKTRIEGECVVWSGATNDDGYGYMRVHPRLELPLPAIARAHRIAYVLFVGPLDHDTVLDHKCRNRRCVRHDHLRPCSHLANSLEATVYREHGEDAANMFWEETDGF